MCDVFICSDSGVGLCEDDRKLLEELGQRKSSLNRCDSGGEISSDISGGGNISGERDRSRGRSVERKHSLEKIQKLFMSDNVREEKVEGREERSDSNNNMGQERDRNRGGQERDRNRGGQEDEGQAGCAGREDKFVVSEITFTSVC